MAATTFTLYLKRKGGSETLAQKAVTLLKTYLPALIENNANFTTADAVYVDEKTTPTLLETDVVVYMVKSTYDSVIVKKGGSIQMAEANGNVMGLTDLNKKICEVYFDRIYPDSARELAGACYHELAHIKSNKDNSLHKGQDGFLKDAPDYNGTPTTKNNEFIRGHMNTKVKMDGSY